MFHGCPHITPAEDSDKDGNGLQDIKFNVHAHPTLSEVLDELFKAAHVDAKAPGQVCLSEVSSVPFIAHSWSRMLEPVPVWA